MFSRFGRSKSPPPPTSPIRDEDFDEEEQQFVLVDEATFPTGTIAVICECPVLLFCSFGAYMCVWIVCNVVPSCHVRSPSAPPRLRSPRPR